jgi:signal transduction histidine kinase
MVNNALKYSLPESNVLINIENAKIATENEIRIRISNTVGSAGRPNLQKVFTRYYREESSKNVVGAGLGLWLANTLAIKLGSELQCSSDDDWVHFDFILERH